MIKRYVILAICLLFVGVAAACQPFVAQLKGETVPTHNEAYVATIEDLDITRSVEMYEQIAAKSWNRGDRDLAEIRLATLDWRVYGDYDQARRRLEQVIGHRDRKLDALLALVNMELSQGNYEAAKETARQAMTAADKTGGLRFAQEKFAEAIIKQSIAARLTVYSQEGDVTKSESSETELRQAQTLLREMISAEPGYLKPAKLWLQVSLLLNEGDSALEAWRGYYWLVPGEMPDGELATPFQELMEILPHWNGKGASESERDRLIQALANSRFYQEAALIALDPGVKTPHSDAADEIVAYARFLYQLEQDLDNYYRRALVDGYSITAKQVFMEKLDLLCGQVNCPEGRGNRAKENYVRDRFGVMWDFGRTDYHDLYMGHTILDEERIIEQYGKSATIHLLHVDHLVSHGIRSWIFDELYFVGGFAEYDRFVEFRPYRVKLLMGLAQRVVDPERRAEINENVERNRKQDEKLAAEDPYAHLPGLNSRLIQRSLEEIWVDVYEPDTPHGLALMRFLMALDQVWQEGPMIAHEGRHVIDFQRGNSNRVGLEYGAKLAETAFCRYPGIPLGHNILHPYGIGGHSEANRQIIKGYVAWMETNASEIDGLDVSQPIFPQLDLLTDEQLRHVARELDPLAATGFSEISGDT